MSSTMSYAAKPEQQGPGMLAMLCGVAALIQVPVFFFRSQIIGLVIAYVPELTGPSSMGFTRLRGGLASALILAPSILAVILAIVVLVRGPRRPVDRAVVLFGGLAGVLWLALRLWGALTEYSGWQRLHTPFWQHGW